MHPSYKWGERGDLNYKLAVFYKLLYLCLYRYMIITFILIINYLQPIYMLK